MFGLVSAADSGPARNSKASPKRNGLMLTPGGNNAESLSCNRRRLLDLQNHSIGGPQCFEFRMGRRLADRTPTCVLLLSLRHLFEKSLELLEAPEKGFSQDRPRVDHVGVRQPACKLR